MIDTLIILGNHIQALGLSRMAAKIGLKVILYNNYKASITRFSNTCDKFYLFKDKKDLYRQLIEKHDENKAILQATNDEMVGFIKDYYNELKEKYSLPLPQPDIINICYNKRLTYKKAKSLGIPIPKSYFPDNFKEVQILAETLNYPVILKPAVMHTFYGATGKKVFRCDNKEQLLIHYDSITKIIPKDEVIVQQFLKGGAKTLFSFGSFSANGEVLGGFVANRIRQKPMDFGISTCFAKSVVQPEIEKYAFTFLKSLKYLGLSEVEFMYDEESNGFKLIEINPRAWKWHAIANKLDIHLLEMMVQYFNEEKIDKKINRIPDIGWVERLIDTFVVLNEIRKGKMSMKEYYKTISLSKESAAWSWKDPLPPLLYVLMSPYLLIKRSRS